MRRYTSNTVVLVEEISVYLEYEVTTESSYGADADGNRGEYREECEIIDSYILKPNPVSLTRAQVKWILRTAEQTFLRERGFM